MRSSDHPRRETAALAGRQHGVVAHHQLLALGFGKSAIQHQIATGRLHRLYLGVYAVGHRRVGRRGRWLAAVLACGPDAVLSHRDAAALWGIRQSAREAIDVTVPGRSRRGQSGLTLHRVRRLDAQDRGEVDAIPVTTVARTLLDLAEVVRPRELARAVEEAERLRLFDLRAIDDGCRRGRGRRGLRPLTALLAEYREPPPTRSELERRFLDLCRTAGLPEPAVNVAVKGFEVDAVWRDPKVVVELDGYAFHRTRDAYERDRFKDAELQLAEYRVLRFTHRRLAHDREAVIETLRSALAS
jgi:predicted transcriptional regulator of viral defense system